MHNAIVRDGARCIVADAEALRRGFLTIPFENTVSRERNARSIGESLKSGKPNGTRFPLDSKVKFWGNMSISELAEHRSYAPGRENIDHCKAAIVDGLTAPQSIKRIRQWTDGPDGAFDFARYLDGADRPFSHRRRERMPTGGPIIRVTFAIGGGAMHSESELSWTGAAGAAVVDTLESAGYRCEVSALSHSRNSFLQAPYDSLTEIPIKRADDPLDIDALALVATSPGFFRALVIMNRNLVGQCSDSFGATDDIPNWARGDIHFAHAYTMEDAIDAARAALQGLQGLQEVKG